MHGWFSEHPNQFVLQTDNIRFRVDQQDKNLVYQPFGAAVNKSTCFFTTFNGNCYSAQQARLTKKALVDIQIEATNDIAINLIINGDVNMQINGNKYQQINGDIYQTHIGNRYVRHEGQTFIENFGQYNITQTKDVTIGITGKSNITNLGDFTFTTQCCTTTTFDLAGACIFKSHGKSNYTYCGQVIENYAVSETKNVNGMLKLNALNYSINAKNNETITINDGKTVFNDSVTIKAGTTGIITLTNIAQVVDGIVIGIG